MGWGPLAADAPLDGAQPPVQPQTATPAPSEPSSAPASPAGFAPLPADAQLDNAPATKVAAGYTTQAGFDDQLPAHAHPLPPELEKQLLDILANDPVETAASHARQVASEHGISPFASTDPKFADSFDQTIAFRKKYHTISNSIVNRLGTDNTKDYFLQGPAADTTRAGIRGAASFLPVNTVDAALHAGADALTGNAPDGIGADFNRWSDINYGVQQGDEENHPTARLVGQIIGGLAIPTGYEGAALNAGKSILKFGGSMAEARAAAAAAARTRLAQEGATVGAVHGFDTAAPGQGVAGGVEGAATGGAGGYALAAAGQAAPKLLSAVRGAVPAAEEAAPDYVQLARDLNVRRTPATNSKSGVSTVVQAGLGALPGGTPIGQAAGREAGDLAATAQNVAQSVGQVSDHQGAGEALAQGAQQYKAATKLTANEMYGARDALMGGPQVPVPTDNARSAIQNMAAKFPNSPAIQQLREHPAIRAIGGALPGEPTTEDVPTGILNADGSMITRPVTSGGEPLNLGEVTEALSHVRGVKRNLAAQSNTTPPVLARVSQLEQSLEDDVTTAASKADRAAGREPGAEGSALKAQQDADAFYADRAQALNGSLKKPLQSATDDTKMSGEAVYNQVAADMDAKSGNLARLRDTWFRLPSEAKSTFAATKIDDLGRATPGQQNADGSAWSFQSFLTNVNKLSPQARNIVFGGSADRQLQQIAVYANRLRQLDRMRNFSNTAQKYFAGAFMATVGGAVMHGDLGSAAEAAMAIPATWGGAKILLSTPAMRDWTAQAMKAAVSGNENMAKGLTARLGSIASSEPAIANDVLGLKQTILRAVNDNIAQVPVAASKPQENQRNQKANGAHP